MRRIKKATAAERKAYLASNPTYPLYGWYVLDGHRCPVEDLRGCWGPEDPQYELLTPDRYNLQGWGTHTLLGFTLRDLEEQLSYESLWPCEKGCDCGWDR